MPEQKHNGVFITCAVTGGGATTAKSDKVPVTPEEIANSCIEAAKAGAAITHVHVREDDGAPSRDIGKYAEVVERKPEICTLDCGTMNFGEGDYVMTNTPSQLSRGALPTISTRSWQCATTSPTTGRSRRLASAAISSSTCRSLRLPVATYESASRTTSISTVGCSRPTVRQRRADPH